MNRKMYGVGNVVSGFDEGIVLNGLVFLGDTLQSINGVGHRMMDCADIKRCMAGLDTCQGVELVIARPSRILYDLDGVDVRIAESMRNKKTIIRDA